MEHHTERCTVNTLYDQTNLQEFNTIHGIIKKFHTLGNATPSGSSLATRAFSCYNRNSKHSTEVRTRNLFWLTLLASLLVIHQLRHASWSFVMEHSVKSKVYNDFL